MKKFFGGILVGLGLILLGISYLAFNSPDQYQSIKSLPAYNISDVLNNSPLKRDPVIAMYRPEHHLFKKNKEQFYCTAFVISDQLALTAAHCLVDDEYFMTKDDIQIRDLNLDDTNIVAHAGAINIRADMGLLVGDFSSFNKFPLALHPGGLLSAKGPVITCGFAWGSKPVLCTPFIPHQNDNFLEGGTGRLYPGMSGGPVIDLGNANIIGINTQVGDGEVMFTPTVGLIGALELQVVQ